MTGQAAPLDGHVQNQSEPSLVLLQTFFDCLAPVDFQPKLVVACAQTGDEHHQRQVIGGTGNQIREGPGLEAKRFVISQRDGTTHHPFDVEVSSDMLTEEGLVVLYQRHAQMKLAVATQ